MGFPTDALVSAEVQAVADFVCGICHNLADYSNVSHTVCTHGARSRPVARG